MPGVCVRVRRQEDRTCLHFAAMSNHGDAVLWLLKHGADHKARDAAGKTPKDYAAQAAHRKQLSHAPALDYLRKADSTLRLCCARCGSTAHLTVSARVLRHTTNPQRPDACIKDVRCAED